MYIRTLTIKNLRTITDAKITFAVPGDSPGSSAHHDNVTVFLGDNGAGKTTVLCAVAMSAVASSIVSGSGWVPYCLVRRVGDERPDEAEVQGTFDFDVSHEGRGGSFRQELTLTPGEGLTDRPSHRVFHEDARDHDLQRFFDSHLRGVVLGYGADRRVETGRLTDIEVRYKRRALRYDRIAGLFEEAVPLVQIAAWLPRMHEQQPARHDEVVALLNEVLPDGEVSPTPEEGEHHFRVRGSHLPLAALSDGYRAFLGWFSDMLYHLCQSTSPGRELSRTSGIVLVDEIDLHLHPAWQREVVARVARALPRVQFIFTTHSPLVVGSLHRDNVRVLEDRLVEGDVRETLVQSPSAETFGLGVEQLLTSDVFGLESTRPAAFVASLKKEAERASGGDTDAALRFLRMMSFGAAGQEKANGAASVKRRVSSKSARRKKG